MTPEEEIARMAAHIVKLVLIQDRMVQDLATCYGATTQWVRIKHGIKEK